MKKRKTIVSVVSIFVILVLLGGFNALAGDVPTVNATGILTSIQEDGSVIIDNKGYQVDPSATILNRKGKTIALRSLSLPTSVRFEYKQAKNGFIIVLIQQVKAKNVKFKGGSK